MRSNLTALFLKRLIPNNCFIVKTLFITVRHTVYTVVIGSRAIKEAKKMVAFVFIIYCYGQTGFQER